MSVAPLPTPTYRPPGYDGETRPRMGFFTDTSVCIGCKACEVACKEWNLVPGSPLEWTGNSFDNTMQLGADNRRHVAFIEQAKPVGVPDLDLAGSAAAAAGLAAAPGVEGAAPPIAREGMRWLMASDVCKHCTSAACLDVCPTGALFRTEFGTVVVQPDICNGCGYCVLGPNRSVLIRCGSWSWSMSRLATASTKPVGPQTKLPAGRRAASPGR